MSGSKVELRCDMLEIVEEGVREVMSMEAGASGRRWSLAEWLYAVWLVPKIDNARPFVDRGLSADCRPAGFNEWSTVDSGG